MPGVMNSNMKSTARSSGRELGIVDELAAKGAVSCLSGPLSDRRRS
jgi:hypothetical protein